ncbi:N-acyl-D-amino-acid deacylase family protein [Dermatobacter hominis]|uniref:N-acyl-D-amino-acid deacylase family protein n=1 Tax=Dermatobacter hominis TaxID=2884263 RepID=UPI001D12DAD4|nr:amidohydrolase family protein [Dermatobacter hominis]UDY34738.1 amidohydrolase family protein [Dermatobacter hominis]
MAHDLVIRGGRLVDGTGAPARPADVAVDDGTVTEVTGPGDAGRGDREIDADGLVVTPGFVDLHTHLDAQVAWDPLGTSSSWHGVTSVVMGNCGVTFAPCRPDDRAYLADMMESVEDIPAESIMAALPWDWETYGGYLDSLERTPSAMNLGGMVGHCALRYWAMGDRSMDPDAEPTAAELEEMVGLLDEAMAAGALGFSTSRTLRHKVPDGRQVPGTFADREELLTLAGVLGGWRRGIFESAPRFDGEGPSEPRCRSELEWMREVALRTGRPVTFNLTHTFENPEHHRLAVELARAANAEGALIRPQTTSRGIGVLFSLQSATPFGRHPSWAALRDLDLGGRLAAIRDPETRSRLIAEAESGPSAEELTRFFVTGADGVPGQRDGIARYDCDPRSSLPAVAAERGVSMAEAFLDLCDRTDGRVLVYWPLLNQSMDAIAEMLLDDTVIMGLADAGAHVGQILDASQPTWFLTHWTRDHGLVPIERAVQRLSSDTADFVGLTDRGRVVPGAAADINVIDWDGLALPVPEFAHDLPKGAGRWIQRAEGYVATVVNGTVALEHGEHTGELPGTVLRSGPDER